MGNYKKSGGKGWTLYWYLPKQESRTSKCCIGRFNGSKKYADITISIDCDGQDDITAMEVMINEYHNGCEIVYGVRSKRDTDTFFLKE